MTESALLGFGPWWSSAWSSDLGMKCAAIAGVGALVLAAAVRAGWRLRSPAPGNRSPGTGDDGRERGRPTAMDRLQSEEGTATIEFLLVLVPGLTVALILLQTVLVFSGNLFVHYAAFVATRSAIVNAPSGELGGGGSLSSDGDPAFDRAERSAAFALAPVSGRLETAGGDPASFEAGLESFYRASNQEPPAWVGNLAAERLAYAMQHTQIELYETLVTDNGGVDLVLAEQTPGDPTDPESQPSATIAFGPKDPVTIGVQHRLNLSIPWAAFFFSDGTHDTAVGEMPFAQISATSTMTLEGHDVNLPPLPEVERE